MPIRLSRMCWSAFTGSLLLAGCAMQDAADIVPARKIVPEWVGTNSPVIVNMHNVAARIPHDPKALTQGLYYKNGEFIESTGGYGRSSIRRIDAESGTIKTIRHLPEKLFGEGCAPTPRGIIQLTWRNKVALRYDKETLNLIAHRPYPREGWGLLYDGTNLLASDGSDKLYTLDPETLKTRNTVLVKTIDGHPVTMLNEMAWVKGLALANVFMTDLIVAIDIKTGLIRQCWDLSDIVCNENNSDPEHVLNGIAHDPETGRIWVTGKGWSGIYEVRLPEWPD